MKKNLIAICFVFAFGVASAQENSIPCPSVATTNDCSDDFSLQFALDTSEIDIIEKYGSINPAVLKFRSYLHSYQSDSTHLRTVAIAVAPERESAMIEAETLAWRKMFSLLGENIKSFNPSRPSNPISILFESEDKELYAYVTVFEVLKEN